MTPRQKNIVYMALSYMKANIDDVNDSFANFTDDDPNNEAGNVLVGKKVMQSVDENEIEALIKILKGNKK